MIIPHWILYAWFALAALLLLVDEHQQAQEEVRALQPA